MKKLIASAIAASMLITTTPAFADHRDRDRGRIDQPRRGAGSGIQWGQQLIKDGVAAGDGYGYGSVSNSDKIRRTGGYD
jgi:hypothetical protein